jgi:hypothetical protein
VQFLAAAGLVMLLTGIASYYATERELNLFFIGNIVIGPLLILIAGIVQARRFRGFSGALSRRVVVRWSAILLGVLVAVFAAERAGRRWSFRIDFSIDKEYTLSQQTLQLCGELAQRDAAGVELLFFEEAKLSPQVEPLVRAYQSHCPDLAVRFLSSQEAPPSAQSILNQYDTTLVGCAGSRCEPVGFPSEENISNAILRLSRSERIVAYFMLGHGEVNLGSEAEHGFSGLASVLAAEGLEVKGWIGPAHREVPEEASLVIVASPERDLLPDELEALDRYLDEGGRLLALLEPGLDSNLSGLLEKWGFAVPPGVVVDLATSPLLAEARPVSLLVNSFGSHSITRPLGRRTMMLLPSARLVIPQRKPEPDDRLSAIVFSSHRAWAERDVQAALADRPVHRDPEEPGDRELPLAAAGRYPRGDRETRIVVIGERDFASNRLLGSLYNRDLLLNSVLWLVEDETRIAIRAKVWTPFQHPLTVQQTLAYFYFLAFALPEVLLLLGLRAWYRQRQ